MPHGDRHDSRQSRAVAHMCRSRGPRAAADGSTSRARSTERFFALAPDVGDPAVGASWRSRRMPKAISTAGNPFVSAAAITLSPHNARIKPTVRNTTNPPSRRMARPLAVVVDLWPGVRPHPAPRFVA